MNVSLPSRRLIVVTYHFPPDGAVGGLRWSGISKNLVKYGWEVHVVTAAKQEGWDAVPGVTVHYRPRRRTFNDIYNDRVQRRRATQPATPAASAASAVLAEAPPEPSRSEHLWSRVRRDLGAMLAFPDFGRGWIWRAAATARSLLRGDGRDVVVSSGPPHSAHVAAALACLGTPVPCVVDMRDPWVSMMEVTRAQTISDSRWMRALLERMERHVLRGARHVVANTPEFLALLQQTYPGLPASCIPNGIDLERLPASAPKFDGLSIAYAGNLYLSRDLTPVIRALAGFTRRHPDARHVTRLRVAGEMDEEHRARFWQEVDDAGLRDAVDVLGRISGEEALELVNRSHLAVVLAQRQPTQVPAKIYECVAMQVCTLVVGEAASAAVREGRRIGAETCEADDIGGICAILERLWTNAPHAPRPAASVSYDAIAGDVNRLLGPLLMPSGESSLAFPPGAKH